MSTKTDEPAPTTASAPEHRRWLIGVGISIFFGLFGVVMALLTYSDRGKPPPPPAAATAVPRAEPPSPPDNPASSPGRGKGKGHGRE